VKYAAAAAGQLPAAADAIVGGVRLPRGRLISPDPEFLSAPGSTAPVLWLAESGESGVISRIFGRAKPDYAALVAAFPRTGLWPLLCHSLDGDGARPWGDGELDPPGSSSPDLHEPARVLADAWANAMPPPDEAGDEFLAALAPFGRTFPGMAPPVTGADDDGAVAAAVAKAKGFLGLVAVARPADAVAAIGWNGPANHFSDMGLLAAVLRSWEDRFGAVVVGIGFDTLTLAVQRPVRDRQAAELLAAEHLAMCPDNIFQGIGGVREYAETLVGARAWPFWWD
jgi:hypothetical protein